MKNFTHNLLSTLQNLSLALLLLTSLVGTQVQASKLNKNAKAFVVETNRVWLNVTDTNGAFCQTLFGYRAGATDGYDHGLDGAFMNDGAVAFASLIGDVRYAIQFKGLPFNASSEVPLSFNATYNGTYTLAIDHCDGFFLGANFGVYIHDTLTNTYVNLKNGGYTFTSTAGMFNSRFQLAYSVPSGNLAVTDTVFTANNLMVYKNNTSIVINTGTVDLKEITLYSIAGQELYRSNNVNSHLVEIESLNVNHQPIIVKATTQDGITVTKKWLCQ
jgi:hypothetical protein